jgi:hypothetical protein
MRKYMLGVMTFLLTGSALLAQGGNNPIISVFENGNGTIQFPGSPANPFPGVLTADPGPGGLGSALTFNMQGPPGLIAGDLQLQESLGGTLFLTDIIRFNPAGTAPGYPASLVFYSDTDDAPLLLADTGLPAASYTNIVTLFEGALADGSTGIVYTPTAAQPGFVPGFGVTYVITSDAIPEPASAALFAIAACMLLAGRRWLKARAN